MGTLFHHSGTPTPARLAPPSYTQVLGIEPHLRQLSELLTNLGPPWIVALSGMGGIGKTTLADAVVRGLVCEIEPEGVVQALETLVRLNLVLVDVRGDLHQRRYTIHNLTCTFLHEQVLRWQ